VSSCSSDDLAISSIGKGKTKKIAEQEAAKLLLEEHFKNE
jgi:dsRNA-specific ribonuclease